ncbi:MAG: archaeosortase/exosortase family protein, partial [Pseudomonadota bacterium]
MSVSSIDRGFGRFEGVFTNNGGIALFVLNAMLAVVVFSEGIGALFEGWQLAEYSHGPLIPFLSGLLFLRQLKTVPVNHGPVNDRWVGIVVLAIAVSVALIGKFARIPDVVAYS